jgi:DNA polymerase III epsilon subunit-like protein
VRSGEVRRHPQDRLRHRDHRAQPERGPHRHRRADRARRRPGRQGHVLAHQPRRAHPAEATEVHGIDDAKAAQGADPKEALDDIAENLAAGLRYGMPVVAFNLSFDWTVLARELARYGLPSMPERLTGI